MNSEIYYFSGTGNSLAVARGLADKIDANLTAIAATINKEIIHPETEMIGIVFPVYHGGLPQIVTHFVEKLTSIEEKYVFGVCTYGDSPGLALEYLSRLVSSRGGQLAGGFGIHMPYNYITPAFNLKDFLGSFTLREINPEKQQILFADARKKIAQISSYVNSQQTGTLERDAVVISRLVDSVHLHDSLGKFFWLRIAGVTEPTGMPFRESIQWMDRAFFADEKCQGCGKCSEVCPVGNIELVNNKPVWHQHCEQCFACLQWCPQEAVQFGKNTTGRKRYQNPEVKLKDMLQTNN
jgi:ferredoxin/flavodoxin